MYSGVFSPLGQREVFSYRHAVDQDRRLRQYLRIRFDKCLYGAIEEENLHHLHLACGPGRYVTLPVTLNGQYIH